jgi:plastocyanin
MSSARRPPRYPILILLSALSLPASAGAQATGEAGGGRLEGQVVLSRELSQRRPRFRLYAERGGQAVPLAQASDTVEYGNVVVYLESVPSPTTAGAESGTLAIRQRNEAFEPHVLPVLAGSTVRFPNDDSFFHNVFSLSRTKQFDLGRFPKGVAKSVVFDRPGVVQIFCHIHSDMSAIVLVRGNPYFAVPDTRGRFAIDGIPSGEYRVIAWHERVRPYSATVKIVAGQATAVEFTIPLSNDQQRP